MTRPLLLLALLACMLNAARAQQPAACPPPPTMPSPEQLAAAQRDARDRGLLWRLQRDGGHVSYLYGTLHVGKLDWAMPGPALANAIRNTDTLALELDPTDPEVLRALTQPAGGGEAPALPAELAERLARQRQAACVPDGAFGSMHPLMQGVSLVVLNARHEGLDPAYASEVVLASAARTLKRPVHSLETAADQVKALVPSEPQAMQESLAQLLGQLEQGKTRPQVRRLAQAWADGRLDELENYAAWCDCVHTDADRATMARLLDQRNPGLARGIDALHRQGKKLLAAVGALHMAGAQGLPALLRGMGYEVQRVGAP